LITFFTSRPRSARLHRRPALLAPDNTERAQPALAAFDTDKPPLAVVAADLVVGGEILVDGLLQLLTQSALSPPLECAW
jgi:hypothetical protein